MPASKPITVEYVAEESYEGPEPQPFAIIGTAPLTEETLVPQEAPVIDDTPDSEVAVAADLKAVVDALVLAGVFTAPE